MLSTEAIGRSMERQFIHLQQEETGQREREEVTGGKTDVQGKKRKKREIK